MMFKCLLALLLMNSHITLSDDDDDAVAQKKRNPQHKRPQNGTGTILISYNNSIRHRNEQRILIVFDLLCVGNISQSDASLLSKIGEIRQSYSDCLDLYKLSAVHFDTANYSYVWMDLLCKIGTIQQKKNITIDYDDLCIEYIMYEPLFWPNQTSKPMTPSPVPDPPQCTNITTDKYRSWGLDLLDSARMDSSYSMVDVHTIPDNANLDLFVIDSGIQAQHREFSAEQVIHEMGDGPSSRVNQFGDTIYDIHGTHVAGTMAGINYGSSHGLTIYDYRVCEHDENGDVPCYTSLITDALERVASKLKSDPGRRGVINLSLGGEKSTAMNDIYHSYFDKLLEVGGIAVVAAGNEDVDACGVSPAYSSNAITVGAFDWDRKKSVFSNWGKCVDIWGPGQQIWSSIPSSTKDEYRFLSGTSMASPMIAGVVANILAVSATLSKEQVLKVLLNDSELIADGECEEYECRAPLYFCGKGIRGDGEWEYSDRLSAWQIVLIVIGCGLFVMVLVFCVSYIMKYNKEVPHVRVPDKENPNVTGGNVEEKQAITLASEGNDHTEMYDVYV